MKQALRHSVAAAVQCSIFTTPRLPSARPGSGIFASRQRSILLDARAQCVDGGEARVVLRGPRVDRWRGDSSGSNGQHDRQARPRRSGAPPDRSDPRWCNRWCNADNSTVSPPQRRCSEGVATMVCLIKYGRVRFPVSNSRLVGRPPGRCGEAQVSNHFGHRSPTILPLRIKGTCVRLWSWGESNPRPSAGVRTRYDHSRHCH